MTGCKVDFDRVGEVLRESPIVVIDANPGSGKISLAYHVALHARDSEFVTHVDWNTDKRVMIDIDGKERDTHQPPLTYEAVLLSMANRFGWMYWKPRIPDCAALRICAVSICAERCV